MKRLVSSVSKRYYSQYKYVGKNGTIYEAFVKRSRFIAVSKYVSSVEEVNFILNEARYDKANHHCWAYRIGEQEKCYDDGEPLGSAGRPILSAIKSLDIQNVVVIVVRYFGGIKLGLSGLVRAYGGCARKCLLSAPFEVAPPIHVSVEVHTNLQDIDKIYSQIAAIKYARVVSEIHDESNVVMVVVILEGNLMKFSESLKTSTKGRVSIVVDYIKKIVT